MQDVPAKGMEIMGKTLVAYFSVSGVTARAAKAIAEALGADLFEIAPAEPYTAADLDWTNKRSRSSIEMDDPTCRPALAGRVEDMDAYDMVLVGFPIWWGVEPRAVDTFFEAYDFSGKAMVPFATSGGSGIGRAEQSVRAHCPAGSWKPGALVTAGGAAAWARQLNEL